MKKAFSVALPLMVAAVVLGQSDKSNNLGKDSRGLQIASAPQVVERGGNHNVWQWLSSYEDPSGKTVYLKNQYVQLESGLNHLTKEGYVASTENIVVDKDGATASGSQHTAYFKGDISDDAAVTLVMSDGKKLATRVLGLSFFEKSTGKSVLFAEVQSAQGEVQGNQVIYKDCFTGVKASLRYTYTKAGFEQDVILDENPASPADYGLDPEQTCIEVWTEDVGGDSPVNKTLDLENGDSVIDFGTMQMGEGKAFSLENKADSTPVRKYWETHEGRQFLIEQVGYPEVIPALDLLPQAPAIENTGSKDDGLGRVNDHRVFPKKRLIAGKKAREMKVASAKTLSKGFVMDYLTLNSSSDFTFKGRVTYYVSGVTAFSGTTTIEAAIIKYASGGSITFNGPVVFKTTAYRPLLVLSKDDESAGDTISGSTGSPSGYYAVTALNFNTGTSINLQNIRVSNAQTAIGINGSSGHVLTDVQIQNSQTGIAATNTSYTLRNALFYNVTTNFRGSSVTAVVQHLTSDTATLLNTGTTLSVINSLLYGVTSTGTLHANCRLHAFHKPISIGWRRLPLSG